MTERPVGWTPEVPEAVHARARTVGPVALRWLEDLPALIRELEADWRVTVGATLRGGSAAYVAAVTTEDGEDAVLKLHLPGDELDSAANEARALRIAGGRGYVRLLRADEACGALLLERLGPRLGDLGLPVARQVEIVCETFRHAWVSAPGIESLPSGAEKARWLRGFIEETWGALGEPCSNAVVDRAIAYGRTREAAHDPARAVLVHGDAHSMNTLARLTPGATDGPREFAFVDPDGLFAEPAYDLAIPMRSWSEELLAGNALALGRERCARLGELTAVDPEAIWEWGFVERVSTGFVLLQIGMERDGRDYLRVAEAWAASDGWVAP